MRRGIEDIMKQWVRDHIEEIFLFCCLAVVISMFLFRYGCFASDVDWMSQHSVFPDYFRKLFYKTGKLIPSFASNIGGGQNIFNFSYYGLLSPLILPSYLLPFVTMDTYLSVISVICILSSVLLLYHWLRSKGFRGRLSCSMAVMYLFATPVLFQSYTQWMFVNYMPFLILAFMGVDRFMQKKKPLMLCFSIFLMVMTSYYFSIGGLFALALYQIAYAIRETVPFRLKEFLLLELRTAIYVLTSLLMSGVLLVPTAFTLLGRSSDSKQTVTLAELLIPDVKWTHLVYSGYGIGLTTLLLTAVFGVIFYKKAWERFLGYSLLLVLFVPFFEYLLNGGLYLRGKVLIPFLPLLLYWMAYFLMKMRDRLLSPRAVSFCFGITVFLAAIYCDFKIKELQYFILFDAVLMFLCHFLYEKTRKMACIVVPVFVLMGTFSTGFHGMQNNMVSEQLFAEIDAQEYQSLIKELKDQDLYGYRIETRGSDQENFVNINRIYDMEQSISTIYSSAYAAKYDAFRKHVFGLNEPHRNILMQGMTNNRVFLKMMGVKYLISNQKLDAKVCKKEGKNVVYDNGEVAPLGYVTNTLLDEKQYELLEYPYNQIAFLHGTVTNRQTENLQKTSEAIVHQMQQEVSPVSFDLGSIQSKLLTIDEEENGYHIVSKGNATVKANIQIPKRGANYLFVEFDVKNNRKKQDMSIRIENEKNKLTDRSHVYYNRNKTFRFAVACKQNLKKLHISFGKGDYQIYNVKCYAAKISEASVKKLYHNKMKITDNWTTGGILQGTVDSAEDGKLVTSIPNADGFSLFVDGKKAKIEDINYAFIGTSLTAGTHRIKLVYESPGLRVGKYVSVVGFLLCFILCLIRIFTGCRRKKFVLQ